MTSYFEAIDFFSLPNKRKVLDPFNSLVFIQYFAQYHLGCQEKAVSNLTKLNT